jgi:hypothetical protein
MVRAYYKIRESRIRKRILEVVRAVGAASGFSDNKKRWHLPSLAVAPPPRSAGRPFLAKSVEAVRAQP